MRRLLSLALAAGLLAGPAFAQDSAVHFSRAVDGASDSLGNLAASGAQTAAGVLMLPLAVVGTVSVGVGASALAGGSVLAGAGSAVAQTAGNVLTDAWGPLTVDDRVVVAPDPAPRLAVAPARPARQ